MEKLDEQLESEIRAEVKGHILYLSKKWRGRKLPTCLDFMQALAIPPDHVIICYNELVEEGKIKGNLFVKCGM